MTDRLRNSQTAPAWRARPAVLTAVVACLAALLAGCAPKRVVQGRAHYGDLPPRATSVPRQTAATPTIPVPTIAPPEPAEALSEEELATFTPVSVELGVLAAGLACEQLGKPYRWGASGPDCFDCSGLVQHVYGELGFAMPRTAREQAARGKPVLPSELQEGDLVFFAINGGGIDHVGICVGEGRFVHAPRRSTPVSAESLDSDWWRRRYRTARRLG